MADERFSLRTWLMLIVGVAITILWIMSSTTLWRRNYNEAILFFVLGFGLTLLFYRKKIALLVAVGCGWIVVNAGLTAVFHRSIAGVLLLAASSIGFVLSLRQVGKQYGHLAPNDWQKVFNKD